MTAAARIPDVDVLVYGATGYTGELIARELHRRGASFAIAGRNRKRLEALGNELAATLPVETILLSDGAGLAHAARRARVLLAAAGPFRDTGAPLLRAALASGVHFVDISGEQSFLRWAFAQHDAAKAADITVVNAFGFDVVPSDLAAALAVNGLSDVRTVDIAIASQGGLSRGTRRSMAASAGTGWWFDQGKFRPGPPGRFARDFEFPEPLGQRATVFIPWGDVVTAPRTTGAQEVRTFFAMDARRARWLHFSWPVLGFAPRIDAVRKRLEKRAAQAEVGPSVEARAKSRFTIVAEATAGDSSFGRGVVSGSDPYGLTAKTAVDGALRIARGEIAERGVLTPVQAFGVEGLTKMLAEIGVVATRVHDG